MALIMSNCSKDDELSNNQDSDWEIVQGPDEIIADGLIRVDNLLYQVNEDKTCTLLSSQEVTNESDWTSKRYFSSFPYPVFDIPDKVSLNGNTYQVTKVVLTGDTPYEKDNHIGEVKYLSLPSTVLTYYGSDDTNLISLTIGANVRKVSNVRAMKIFWLPNTPPDGYSQAYGKVQYASTIAYGDDVIVYPHLSSMFSIEGISYVMTNPAERKCNLMGVFAPPSGDIKCNGSVTKDGISFDVENIEQFAFYGCTNIADVSLSNIGSIGGYAFYGCADIANASLTNIDSIGDYTFYGCTNITDVSLSNIDNIGNHTFDGCSKLSNVRLDNISVIGNSCFYGCGITKITIPETVSSIDEAAFKHCENLEEITFLDGDKELYLQINFDAKGFDIFSLLFCIYSDSANEVV